MAIGRADDIGDQFPSDSGDVSPTNRIVNRTQFNYIPGLADIAFRIAKSQDPTLEVGGSSGSQNLRGRLKGVTADTLLVAILTDDIEGELVTVAKHRKAQRSVYDGVTRQGITYAYSDDVTRVADDGVDEAIQEIIPAYDVDFDEIVFSEIVGGSGIEGVIYTDLNADGRIWAKTGTP